MENSHRVRARHVVWSLAALIVGCSNVEEIEVTQAEAYIWNSDAAIGFFNAPYIYASTHPNYRADLITNVNFDGDYWVQDAEEEYDHHDLPGYVYYSVARTTTHYFVQYWFYHPYDSAVFPNDSDGDAHENDLEGMVLMLRAWGNNCSDGNGCLEGMATFAHNDWYHWNYVSGFTSGGDGIDGDIELLNGRPKVFVESGGHGVGSCNEYLDGLYANCSLAPGGTGFIYEPCDLDGCNDEPTVTQMTSNWSTGGYAGYRLIHMNATSGHWGLWALQELGSEGFLSTFPDYGYFASDSDYGKAKAPWAQDDGDDGPNMVGEYFCDPALAFDTALDGTPFNGFDRDYTSGNLYTHLVRVTHIRTDVSTSGSGDAPDLYALVTASREPQGSDTILDARHCKRNNMPVNNFYPYYLFHYERDWPFIEHGELTNAVYFCRPNGSNAPGSVKSWVHFSIYDSDSSGFKNSSYPLSGDDYLGGGGTYDDIDFLSAGYDFGNSRMKMKLTVKTSGW